MDFDSELIQVQGTLMKANNSFEFKNAVPDNEGCEEGIKTIAKYLQDFMTSKNYLIDDSPSPLYQKRIRRITFFLILNSEIDTLDDLADSDSIGHLVRVTPILTKHLLIKLIWKLNLDKFYCEAISFCSVKLSLELLNIASQNMKYCPARKAIERSKHLIIAAYNALDRVWIEKDILEGLFRSFYELTKIFGSSRREYMTGWRLEKLYVEAGLSTLHILEMNVDCLKIYLNKSNEASDPKDIDIYLFTDVGSNDEIEKKDYDKNIVESYFQKCNNVLLEIVRTNLEAINIDIYCSWSEYDYDDDLTLQRAIGETAYNLQGLLKDHNLLSNALSAMISPIASKPLELRDVIRNADDITVFRRSIESSKDKKEWVLAMSKRNFLFNDNQAVGCVYSNIDFLTSDDCKTLFEKGIKVTTNTAELLPKLLLKCFTLLTVECKKNVLRDVYSQIVFDNKLEMKDFDKKIVEMSNKFVKVNDDMITTFMDFFIQNPFKFFTKIFQRCAENKYNSFILDALKVFQDMNDLLYADFHPDMKTATDMNKLESLMICSLKTINIELIKTNFEKDSYLDLIKNLVNEKFISRENIVFKYLMMELNLSVSESKYDHSILYIRCIKEVFETESLKDHVPPFLIQMAYIMEAHRWNVSSYTSNRVKFLEHVIEFQKILLNSFRNRFCKNDKECEWVITRLNILTPINFIYFKDLVFENEKFSLLNDSSDVHEQKIKLCYLLSRSTLEEWKALYKNLSDDHNAIFIFKLLCTIMSIIIPTVKTINTDNGYNCLENCCRNFSIILQEFILPCNNVEDNFEIISQIIHLVKIIPDIKRGICFNMLLTPLSNIIETSVNGSEEKNQCLEKITSFIEKFEDDEHKNILKNFMSKYN